MLGIALSARMPRDERDDAVPSVGVERVAADAGGGVLRRLHGRTVRAAVRCVPNVRSRRQAGGTNAAALADGAAGNANTPDRCPAHDDRRAADGDRATALAHGTTGHRDRAAGTESPFTYADGSAASANTAGADSDRAAADGRARTVSYKCPAGAPGARPVRAGCRRVGIQTTALSYGGAG